MTEEDLERWTAYGRALLKDYWSGQEITESVCDDIRIQMLSHIRGRYAGPLDLVMIRAVPPTGFPQFKATIPKDAKPWTGKVVKRFQVTVIEHGATMPDSTEMEASYLAESIAAGYPDGDDVDVAVICQGIETEEE